MKKVAAIICLLFLSLQLNAFQTINGNKVEITERVTEDLYIAAGEVIINAPIYGDLVIGGGTVTINDSVIGNIIVAGGTIVIKGSVTRHIRAAGGNIVITGNVGGDLIIAGGDIEVAGSAIIYGGVLAGAGNLGIHGTVKGLLKAQAGKISISGKMDGNVEVKAEEIEVRGTVLGPAILAAQHITISKNANFSGGIRYWMKKGKLDAKDFFVTGGIVYDPTLEMESGKWQFLGYATLFALVWYLVTAFLFILIIEFLFTSFMRKTGTRSNVLSGRSLGYGLLFAILAPVAVLVCFITLVGIPVGILLTAASVTIALLSTVIASVVIANWMNSSRGYSWGRMHIVAVALPVFIILKMITLFVPVAGFILVASIVLACFGAIIRNVNWRKKQPVLVQRTE